MKLCYSPTSPYVRKVVVTAMETGLEPGIERIANNVWDPATDIAATNPLGKVPALTTDDGAVLFDSPVICEYLDSLHDGAKLFPAAGPARWRALRQQALCDGILDAGILRMLEGRLRRSSDQGLLTLLEKAWEKKGPTPGQLKRNLGRLRHLIQNQSLSGPSVERRNLVIIEPGESMAQRICYFVRDGLLVDEFEFDLASPPIDELAARTQTVFFGGKAETGEPAKEALEEAAIIAAWLRRELIDGFILELSPKLDLEEVLETLMRSLANPQAAGTCISA